MTLIGKIFTAMILLMSIVFMTLSLMAFATHQNWKVAALNPPAGQSGHDQIYGKPGLKYQIENAELANDSLRRELESLKNEIARERAARRMAIQQLQSKNVLLQTDLEQKDTELNDKTAENGQLLEELKVAQTELRQKTDETGTLREDLKREQQDRQEQFAQVVALSDQVHLHQGEKQRLDERHTVLALQMTEMKRVMDHFGLTVHTPLHNRPPELDGIITQISNVNQNLIEISLGSDDGLRTGHELVVYRENDYLARVVIRKVDSNAAVAEIIRETRRGTIRKGDNVTTRFS